jgi:hypothetical protein
VQPLKEMQRYLGDSSYESGLQTICNELEFSLKVRECWFMTTALHVPQNCLFQMSVPFDTKQNSLFVKRSKINKEFSAQSII